MSTWDLIWRLVPFELFNTIYMVLVSSALAGVIGLPIGIILYQTQKGNLTPNRFIHSILGVIVNIGRSIPFAILIVAIIPFTRLIVGTSIGTTASIVPLTIAAFPFFARIVEGALGEVDRQLIFAAQVMGSTTRQIISKVLLPEALVGLIRGFTLTVVTLIGYSALAGLVGGGGLGKLAIQYGYQRFNGGLMVVTLIILLLLVEIVQGIGHSIASAISKKRGL